ncbi:MAG TPA: serine/threonine-protein kinase, partial [Gemmatales bacterium]|nr:serine/threonine-protein kinase [Gemmatales bacterium]
MSSSSSGQSASSSSQPSPPSDATADAFPLNLGAAVTTWTWTGLPPSTDSLFLPPDFSGYEIIRELGRGGMGVVFLARQTRLGRLVAVKMLTAPFLEPRDLQRLRLEAQTLAALRHPHIVQIHDVGEVTGRPFLALEYVAGGTLAERLRGQPPSPHEAARLVAPLAAAMHAAHAQGIIHRDLKPGNVLLMDADKPDQAPDATSERSDNSELPASRQTARLDERPPATPGQGQLFPKITGFGLAKRLGGSGSQTLSGMIVGTPEYMAPEQAGAHHSDVSPSVDVFALGTILYEMLTGRPPHRGTTLVETLFQVQHLDPL